MDMYGFKQLISKPTRTTSMSATIIDLFFTVNSEVFITSSSDRDMIGAVRKLNMLNFQHEQLSIAIINNMIKSF